MRLEPDERRAHVTGEGVQALAVRDVQAMKRALVLEQQLDITNEVGYNCAQWSARPKQLNREDKPWPRVTSGYKVFFIYTGPCDQTSLSATAVTAR